ncbi:hypothetical protein syc2343_d [Synechococcus elongatus PCC 6301]|uniref:Methyltransferase type 11 domain-containing protein n=1 Tax=Synechococcus sp. (strain ATCC 27144 / PCC 6301 / SAUG 1402/1) TaxID=269084 RepID=A0A0H3K5H8_SYNP6|nr:class I SAM-dependent methyltransferase [Synechococcus elongatus]BAD80533.1 hypothetical protein syc2343_d [Synechococcus elongatus PCC 6301]
MSFSDHFSAVAASYAKARPRYPQRWFRYLARIVPDRQRVWDCATGNGQAAIALAEYFSEVIGSDASAAQVRQARSHPRVQYLVFPAEATPLAPASLDLITVAQAAHWFDLPQFYIEAQRLLRPGGVIALWGYGLGSLNPAIDHVFNHFYRDWLDPYWPPERQWVEQAYEGLSFPFEPLPTPTFSMQCDWTLFDLLAYLRTWSGVQQFQRQRGFDPVWAIAPELQRVWGDPQRYRRITWPLFAKVGRWQPDRVR